jgi:hypothetical protein
MTTLDRTATLCLPIGFTPRGPQSFGRSRGDTLPEQWIALYVNRVTTPLAREQWPVRLASGPTCLADCTTVDSLRSIRDTLVGVVAIGEVGLVSGGFSGEHRTPSLVLNADVGGGVHVVVYAHCSTLAIIDSLRALARTVRLTTQ